MNIKNKKIVEKKRLKVRTMICLLFASNDVITRKTQPNSLLSVDW